MSFQEDASLNTQDSQDWESYSNGDYDDYLAYEDGYNQPSDYEDEPQYELPPDYYLNEPANVRNDAWDWWDSEMFRYDGPNPYRVIRPTHLSLDVINFHIERARGFTDERNSEYEIRMLVHLFAWTYKEFDTTTRRELMEAMFAFFTMDDMSDDIIRNTFYILFDERGLNFKLMCEILDVLETLDENSHWHFVLICAVEWSKSPRRNPKHAKEIRYFTELLDEDHFEEYFERLGFWSDDTEHFKFLITKVFYNWIHDYDFQRKLFEWLCGNVFVASFRFFSSTYGFYRDVVLEGIPNVCATSRHRMVYLHHMWEMMRDDYDLHDNVIDIVFKFIDGLAQSDFAELASLPNLHWAEIVVTLFPVVKTQLSNKDFCLFLCEVMRRLMNINKSELVLKVYSMYFHHLSKVRIVTIFLNWYDENRRHPRILSTWYDALTQTEKDNVFTAMCVADNLPAAQWIMSKQTGRYVVDVIDSHIISYRITEDILDLSIFDQVVDSVLCQFGFKAKASHLLQNKNEECVVCMEPLESTVVLNCHPTHQICEGCCDRMMKMSLKNKCPLCRGSVRPSDCCVYVL